VTYPTSVGGANALGMVTPDYSGSFDEWAAMVTADLIKRYKTGAGGAGGYGNGSIGQPNPADFGTPDTPLSFQTIKYWENYVTKFGKDDPWITANFGAAPTKKASYVPDPNSPSSIYGTFKEKSAFEAAEAEKDRALDRESIAAANARAAAAEAGATARTQMQIDAAWREAQLDAATRRYIAEGDWGVQKWVTTENNAAAMARLQLQLGFEREALAQQAVAERNRHHEQMVGLALEVAKYDAELAASPRNWLKYAGWLQSRNIVVNGMTLAMAAQEVPETDISPATVANTTGDNLAGVQAASEALTSGASGGMASGQDPFANSVPLTTGAERGTAPNANLNDPNAQAQMGQFQPPPSAQQLDQMNPGDLARQLLGMNPLAADEGDITTQNLQNIANSLSTTNRPKVASFGAYNGPRTNALGIEIPEVSGQETDYRQFARLLPSEQEAKIGAIESVRGPYGVTDWAKELESSRPKGRATIAAFG